MRRPITTGGATLAAWRPAALRRQGSVAGFIAAGALVAMLVLLGADAALRGPWLDEFWTLELSDVRKGIFALIADGWLRDTHPPAFNLWATFLTSIGVTSVQAARLASNLLAAGLMIVAALRLSRHMPGQAGFHAAMLLLVLSLPEAMNAFADYRSYFWQIAALATLTLVARHVALTDADLDIRKQPALAVIAVSATAASLGLHYVGGIGGGILAGAIALCAFVKGHRRWAFLVLATAAAAGACVVAVALLQAPNWAVEFDHSWIETEGLAALAVPATLLAGAILHNLVPLAGLWPGWRRWTRPETVFVAMMGGALAGSVAVVLAIDDAVRPIMVERYILHVPVLACAVMAALAARFAHDWRLFGLLALVSVAGVTESFVRQGAALRWHESAEAIAHVVASCPATSVYAASGWALGPAAKTRTARREDPVFERAYASLAERHGYTVRYIGQGEIAHARLGRCPVLIWFEHTPNDAEDDPRAALAASGLKGLERAQLSVIRTATGLVLRAGLPQAAW